MSAHEDQSSARAGILHTLAGFSSHWRKLFLAALTASLLLYARLEYRASYFPPVFWGEEARALDMVRDIRSASESIGLVSSFTQNTAEYNKGFSWLLYPVTSLLGYDEGIVTTVIPAVLCIVIAGFYAVYLSASKRPTSVVSFLLVVGLAVLAVGIRRYKWHTVAYLSSTSLYVYFLPNLVGTLSTPQKRFARAVGATLFLVAFFFYFGTAVFLIPFGFLLFHFRTKGKETRGAAAAAICVFGVGCAAGYLAMINPAWRDRIATVVEDGMHSFSKERWSALIEDTGFFFREQLTLPTRVFLLLGLGALALRSLRRDPMAVVTVAQLVPVTLLVVSSEGFSNPDQLNWLMIPMCAVLLTGADLFVCTMSRSHPAGRVIAWWAIVTSAVFEFLSYPDVSARVPRETNADPLNTMVQAALALRLIQNAPSDGTVYFMPDPKVSVDIGGFNYDDALSRFTLQKAASRVLFFRDADELKSLLDHHRSAPAEIVFVNGLAIQNRNHLAHCLPGSSVVYPFQSVYHIAFPVRAYARTNDNDENGSKAADSAHHGVIGK